VPVWDPNANAIPLPPPPPPPPPVQQRGASPVAVGAGIVGAVIATLLVAALVAATLGTAKEKAPPVRAWKPFQDPSGSFSVDLPGEPSRKEQDQDTAIGKVRITMWVSEYSDMSVGVGYADYPVAFAGMAVRAGLEGAARGGAAGAGGELLSMNFTSQQGFPAVDFTVSVDEGIVEARAIIYGTRVYVLQTAGSNGTFDAHQRLLQSFTIAT
jgi:hypothetical protein